MKDKENNEKIMQYIVVCCKRLLCTNMTNIYTIYVSTSTLLILYNGYSIYKTFVYQNFVSAL